MKPPKDVDNKNHRDVDELKEETLQFMPMQNSKKSLVR